MGSPDFYGSAQRKARKARRDRMEAYIVLGLFASLPFFFVALALALDALERLI